MNFIYIQKLKNYFDIEKLKIRKTGRGCIWITSLLTLILLILTFGFLPLTVASTEGMLVKVNQHAGWFWLKPDQAKEFTVFGSRPWQITQAQCINHKVEADVLTQTDINTICQLFDDIDADDIKTIHAEIRSQLGFCVFMFILCASLFFYVVRQLFRMLLSIDARRMLLKRLRHYRYHVLNR